MDERLKKPYEPIESETKIYDKWEQSGLFNPDNLKNTEGYFSIVLPPPNVTGTLHIGHAFEDTLQDIAVRYHRMKGEKTLWIPGADHAAIATQSKVEKMLDKEGIMKKNLGRDKFLERVNKFAEESKSTIISQVKRMGASLDWSRFAFTLDDKRKIAVNTAFKKLYDLGLIYRGQKVVNWDPKGQTVISDDEVTHEEKDGFLYTFKYWDTFPIAIATTRPETKLGDVAVAVHPEDKRYSDFVGKTYIGEFVGVPLSIKIIADSSIDMEFGTGAVGITPAHSQTDSEIAERHGLPSITVINEFAKIITPRFEGLKTLEAREKIIDILKDIGLLSNEEKIKINISTAERSGGTIEPLPKLQWFIAVNKEFNGKTLKEIMREAVQSQKINIIPENFEKIYFNWIDNLRDWCISRQLWYGHRIPVWYRSTTLTASKEDIFVGADSPGEGWMQDEDTLDTWFSSGLWTFSTLGWPYKTEDLKNFHPNTLMAPGYEILFFWVARMILMSGVLLEEIPFHTVYIHGIVRDKNGEKFSKSAGNGIDPVEIIKKYGADALRMSLIVGVGPGSDSKFDENKVSAYKKFANKIWNATRFVMQNKSEAEDNDTSLSPEDEAEWDKFVELTKDVTLDMENFRFYLAAEKLYHYFWHTFADIIIERKKTDDDKRILYRLLSAQLKLLHPFMPFITEEIWGILHPEADAKLLMIEKWPKL